MLSGQVCVCLATGCCDTSSSVVRGMVACLLSTCLLTSHLQLLPLASPCGERGSSLTRQSSPASKQPHHHQDSCQASMRPHMVNGAQQPQANLEGDLGAAMGPRNMVCKPTPVDTPWHPSSTAPLPCRCLGGQKAKGADPDTHVRTPTATLKTIIAQVSSPAIESPISQSLAAMECPSTGAGLNELGASTWNSARQQHEVTVDRSWD